MEVGNLSASYRPGKGKSSTRKLKAGGMIPAICYGKGEAPITVSVDPAALTKALDPAKRANTVITLSVASTDGYTGPASLMVMLRDWQRHPIKGNVIHADFVRVKMDEDVHATVPIVITGKAIGVKEGGTLHQVFRTLEIACTPDKIPINIEVNVDALDLGDALHVRDVKFPAGVRPRLDGGQTVCVITIPRAEKVVAEVAPVEGAAPAAGAAGAATPAAGAAGSGAAGAKPGDKAAAPAAKTGGDKGAKK